MLDTSTKEQLTQIFSTLESDYVFNVKVRADHEVRTDLLSLLEDTASCSDKLTYRVSEGADLELSILKNGVDIGVYFQAIPNGHEFSSLLLAVLNADGKGKNLPDEMILSRLKRLKGKATITSYISLSCTICPDIVQILNLISILNPNIRHIVKDGALYPQEVDQLKIQAVPTVFLEKELFHIGRGSFGELLEKLEDRLGTDYSIPLQPQTNYLDLLVAGGGPAGVTAAIYAARKGLKVAIVTDRIGGQINETIGIENFISVPYTTGPTLANELGKHLDNYDIRVCANRQIESFTIDGKDKVLHVKGGEEFRAPALIIATGASWRKLNVPGERDYIGRGIAFCPHCDGPFYKGKKVAVIGGGNSGIEAAIDLAGICSEVTVFEFMETLKADAVLQENLQKLENVKVFTSMQVVEVVGNSERMTALKIKNRLSDEVSEYALDGAFVQIGLSANSQLFRESLEVNTIGEILIDKNCRTAIPGIYAAGDVSDVTYKQIIISMGEGAKAALAAFEDNMRGVI